MANRGTDFRKRLLETDVLILGAGGAGVRAAVEAAEVGARVLVVSKGVQNIKCDLGKNKSSRVSGSLLKC